MADRRDELLWSEMLADCGVQDVDMITGAVLILRTKDMETGQLSVCIGKTADTDIVTTTGLLHAAIHIDLQDTWQRVEDA